MWKDESKYSLFNDFNLEFLFFFYFFKINQLGKPNSIEMKCAFASPVGNSTNELKRISF